MEATIALALSVVSAGCGADPIADRREALEVALVSFVDLPSTTLKAIEAEAGAILAPAGEGPRWRRSQPGAELETGVVPVVLLAGRHPVPGRPGAVLGGIETRAPVPAAWVYVGATLRAIGATLPPRSMDPASQRALGVALGRVIAHELVHAMAPRRAHVTIGLMEATWDQGSLLGVRPRLDAASAAAFRAGARRWLSNESDAEPMVERGSEPAEIPVRQCLVHGIHASAAR